MISLQKNSLIITPFKCYSATRLHIDLLIWNVFERMINMKQIGRVTYGLHLTQFLIQHHFLFTNL